jgi:predicted SnoaL-like aldol condensation-catalyzing enzyme
METRLLGQVDAVDSYRSRYLDAYRTGIRRARRTFRTGLGDSLPGRTTPRGSGTLAGGPGGLLAKTRIVGGPEEKSLSNPETNKKNAQDFYDLMFNKCKPREAIEKYVGAEYIQHNPHVGDGKEAFIEYFERMAREYPGKKVSFKRAIAEGKHVVLHCHQEWPGDLEYAGIDIFRFDDDGKVVEHWDVLQEIPSTSKNDNTMF